MAVGSRQEQQHSYHVRSISLPSGSHPLALQFDEQLQKMKTWEEEVESAPSTSSSTEIVCNGVRGLAKLYSCVENILKMPEAQRAIARCKNQKWVAEELDGSVRFLDICGSTRDCLSLMKEQARDLQSTLRTRRATGTDVSIYKNRAKSYVRSNKKASKEISKCLRELKQMDERSLVYPQDEDSLIVRALKEVRKMTTTVQNSIFSSLVSEARTQTSTWSLVSTAMGLKHKNSSSLILALCKKISTKDVDVDVDVVEMQKQLKEIEDGVSHVEDGLECLFQGLISNRVAILNIINM